MLGPSDPGPLPTYSTVKSGGWTAPGGRRGAKQANSFPIAEQVGGKAAPTVITWWSKKKNNQGQVTGRRGKATAGAEATPHTLPGPPINICRGCRAGNPGRDG